MTDVLKVAPLEADAFRPYGEVIAAGNARETLSINEGHARRYHDLAPLDMMEGGGRPVLSLFLSRPKSWPLELALMERHPLGSQVFLPRSERPYLVVVAPPGPFRREALRAFLARGVGVSYRRGTWHHYSLALGEESAFWVIDREGPGENCDEIVLDPPMRVDFGNLLP